MDFKEYIKPELIILIPVLYVIGVGIKKCKRISDNCIPLILGTIGIILSALWVFASSDISGFKEVLIAIFTSVTQGVLVAAASVFSNQIYKQLSDDNKGK